MCGVNGIFSPGGKLNDGHLALVERMNGILKHRGPDDQGLFRTRSCVLGHCRLSIIDLSQDGHQPFASQDGRFQMVYNGEIYNYLELRQELEGLGWNFATRTDTEVLLTMFQQYGPACLNKLNGMFAFAILDSRENTMFLARDRIGIKPLYYTEQHGCFYFSSEIKALLAIPDLNLSSNSQAIFDYLVFNRTDIHDETFTQEIKRLPKGCHATLDRDGMRISQWWSPLDYMGNSLPDDPHEVYRTIEELLVSSVRLRMRSDVAVGSCLSGGLDSSIITGILFSHCLQGKGDDYKTFTACFPGHPLDETAFVDNLNSKYPFSNFRVYPDGGKVLDQLERFTYTNDEPTTNASFFSQYEVMRLAKQEGVTVLLDGQGGDESFAGYQYFHGFFLNGLWKQGRFVALFNHLLQMARRRQEIMAYKTFLFQILPDRFRKHLLLKANPWVNRDFFDQHVDSSRIYREFFDAQDLNMSIARHFQYKMEHLLRTEDRNSMAFSLEARVPYLDYRLVEYLLGISGKMKMRPGETKALQKEAVGAYSIPQILNRTDKVGFGTHGDDWMAMPGWQSLTQDNHQALLRIFPEVFGKDVTLPQTTTLRWKVNQLAVWHRMTL